MRKLLAILNGLLVVLAFAPLPGIASEGEVHLDSAPTDLHDKISLQRGARNFVNYCMGCHSAAYMRFSRLTDLGLTEEQIKEYLVPAGGKVGDAMTVAMRKADGKAWFGVAPPDLSVIARARSTDWLYTYLRTFYRDDTRPNGWNNLVFDKVAMPHVLWQLQGIQVLKAAGKQEHGHKTQVRTLELVAPGQMSAREYDSFVADLVNYLDYMGEPAKGSRTQLGIIVLFFLVLLFVLTLLLKNEYWKDVK